MLCLMQRWREVALWVEILRLGLPVAWLRPALRQEIMLPRRDPATTDSSFTVLSMSIAVPHGSIAADGFPIE